MSTALRAQAILHGHAATPAGTAKAHAVEYDGETRALYGLWFRNLLLTLITLGLYRFWAKTRIRQFLWSHTRIDGEAFEYTGTGKELFVGFLKAVAILAPAFAALELVKFFADANEIARAAIDGIRGIAVVVLIYAGSYAARRYRMSRTLWRGIRFEQTGSIWRYAGTAVGGVILIVLTFGFYYPHWKIRLARQEIGNLRFGSGAFQFAASGRRLLPHFLPFWLVPWALFGVMAVLLIPAINTGLNAELSVVVQFVPLAVVFSFLVSFGLFQAPLNRFLAENTRFGGIRFAYPELTAGRLLRFTIGNWLLTIFSLTLLAPLVLQRTQRFWTRHLHVEGSVNFEAIAQAESGPTSGEGLAGFLNVDLG